jgi:FtsZ-binding cell division protein ZapB
LIKLFQIPKKSTIQTGKLLIYEFQELIKEYNKIRKDEKDKKIKKDDLKRKLEEISAKIKFLIYPVVIRRSRVDLEKIETYKKDLENQ